jgi:hypothetical protein
MISSDFNLQQLNSEQLEQHTSASIEAGSNIFVVGMRGSGKTSIFKQQVAASGYQEVFANLSTYERVDLGGYPNLSSAPDKESKKERFIRYLLPLIYEPMIYGDKPVVFILDEVDKVEKELWAPLLEITQEKSINGRKLPNLRSVLMTGNLISEGGQRPCSPLLDRTEKYLVQADAFYWLKWAANHPDEIHPSVYQFISDQGNKQLFDPADVGENLASRSGRGWHLYSKVLFFGERKGWSLNLLLEKASGFVGKQAGMDFQIYLQNYKVLLPMVQKILLGLPYQEEWRGCTPTEKLYAATIVCSRFATELDAAGSSPPESIKTVGQFMQQCGHENVLMSVKTQLKAARIVKWCLDQNEYWGNVLTDIQLAASNAV